MEDIEYLESGLSQKEIDHLKGVYESVFQLTARKGSGKTCMTCFGDSRTICHGFGVWLGKLMLQAKARDETLDVRDRLNAWLAGIKLIAKKTIGGVDEDVVEEYG